MEKEKSKSVVESLKNGDESALEELFFCYAQDLIYFAGRITGSRAEAENIVQDVFLSLWESREKLDSNKNIKSYLYVSVKNECLKKIRHEQVEKRYNESIIVSFDNNLNPERELLAKENEEIISGTIEQLPEKCREAFTLSRFEKLTYAEIAEVMNISVKTVESHLGRALKQLRLQLKNVLHLFI